MSRVCRLSTRVVGLNLGLVYGLWFIGFGRLLPWETKWLLPSASRLDHAVAQLNWEFLRGARFWELPLGQLPMSGVGWSSVYVPFSSGSLFGLIFRPFEYFLPENFQFLGFWLLFSFAMLGYWSARLVSIVTSLRWAILIGAVLLFSSPIIAFRIGVLGHFELSAHWILFAALCLYLERSTSIGTWMFLLVVSLVVNVYLFAMVFAVVGAVVTREIFVAKSSTLALKLSAAMIVCSLAAFWIFGFLVFSENAKGLGFFRLNAGSFIFPNYAVGGDYSGSFSRLFDRVGVYTDRPFIAFEREGFGYLGFGIIFGSVISLALTVRRWRYVKRQATYSLIPLGVVAGLLLLNSFSNKIAFGRREIFEGPLPSLLNNLRQVFRTAERFSWLAYYLIYLFVIWAITTLVRSKKIAIVTLSMVLLVQLLDISGGVSRSRHALAADPIVVELNDSRWEKILLGKSGIVLVPTFDFISDSHDVEIDAWRKNLAFFPILKLAAQYRLTTNFAVTGRPVTAIVEKDNAATEEALVKGDVDPELIYFFSTSRRWNDVRARMGDSVEFSIIDGYFVMYAK